MPARRTTIRLKSIGLRIQPSIPISIIYGLWSFLNDADTANMGILPTVTIERRGKRSIGVLLSIFLMHLVASNPSKMGILKGLINQRGS